MTQVRLYDFSQEVSCLQVKGNSLQEGCGDEGKKNPETSTNIAAWNVKVWHLIWFHIHWYFRGKESWLSEDVFLWIVKLLAIAKVHVHCQFPQHWLVGFTNSSAWRYCDQSMSVTYKYVEWILSLGKIHSDDRGALHINGECSLWHTHTHAHTRKWKILHWDHSDRFTVRARVITCFRPLSPCQQQWFMPCGAPVHWPSFSPPLVQLVSFWLWDTYSWMQTQLYITSTVICAYFKNVKVLLWKWFGEKNCEKALFMFTFVFSDMVSLCAACLWEVLFSHFNLSELTSTIRTQ